MKKKVQDIEQKLQKATESLEKLHGCMERLCLVVEKLTKKKVAIKASKASIVKKKAKPIDARKLSDAEAIMVRFMSFNSNISKRRLCAMLKISKNTLNKVLTSSRYKHLPSVLDLNNPFKKLTKVYKPKPVQTDKFINKVNKEPFRIKLVEKPWFDRIKGRRRCTVEYANGERRRTNYARYLMQKHLGRRLKLSECVDHIDENKLNDKLSNLQVLSVAENNLKNLLFRARKAKAKHLR